MHSDISTTEFDLIIIGAGINGAGVARDAAMRGLKVCVIEKDDIGSGTSSWSTRLIHGGLRYLEHWEFGLVRESLRERETLLRIAPHLVKPLPIVIPIYDDGRRSRLKIRAGMLLYEVLSFSKTVPSHRMLSRDAALREAPGLRSEGLTSAVIYYDAQVEFAERLVLENILDASQKGAEVITHAPVTRLIVEGERASGVEFIVNGEPQTLRSRFIINAAGPWIDQLLHSAGDQARLIGGTKGSHIVVAPFPGGPSVALYAEARADGRPFFVIPWNGNYLIGTTDLRFDADPDNARCEPIEVEYLLCETNSLIPGANVSLDKILFTYSGVRPLPFTNIDDEGTITRRHFIREHQRVNNVFSLVGGKLTTYRQLSEECVDLLFKRLRETSPTCGTADIPLPGAKSFDSFASEFRASGLTDSSIIERLLSVYGSRTKELFELCAQDANLLKPLSPTSLVLNGEIVFAFQRELAGSLSDCFLRRTMNGLSAGLAVGEDIAAAQIGQQFLGWTEERARQEVADYREYIEKFLPPGTAPWDRTRPACK